MQAANPRQACRAALSLPHVCRSGRLRPLQHRWRPHTAEPQPAGAPQQGSGQQAAQQQRVATVCAAAASAGSAGAAEPEPQQGNTWIYFVALAALFIGWYGTNIYFNILQKQLLKVFPYPLTITAIQFFIGSCLSALFWVTGLVPRPKADRQALRALVPLGSIHVLGNVLTNVSLGAVAVSFTHTVKAMEPFFSAVLSAIFLGDVPKLPVLLSLVPIVGGVIIASVTEATFNWLGFLSALASNITFTSRNVLSKKLMLQKGQMSNMNMFQIITITAFLILAPIAMLVEGVQFTPGALAERGLSEAMQGQVYQWLLLAGLCFHSYQQLSYIILGRVTPVTHSIGNCVKRVVVIVSSVIIFQNPMSTQNMFGTALALSGVFLYSQMKRIYK